LDTLFKILIYGYGNPGRQDDGLGNELVQRLESWVSGMGLAGIEFDSNYQLNIEDAEAILGKDIVVFADASTEEIDDFLLTPVSAESKVSFTTHAASPGYIVQLSKDLFGRQPNVYLLHIKGYEWEFKEGISAKALKNLDKAESFMKELLLKPEKFSGFSGYN
jgi:hydrogenase maturation protease